WPPQVWVLDSPPGARPIEDDPTAPTTVLRHLQSAPVPAPNRDPVRQHLKAQGLPDPIVAWLLTSLKRQPDGTWRWIYDLDGIDAMLQSYATTDLWDTVRAHPTTIQFVRAGRDGRFTLEDETSAKAIPGTTVHTLANAGHWLQVDDPDGLLAVIQTPS
ncbi:MAG: hypothetical protein AAGA48_20130, partial [Myxococcota bacterium]